jgi:hypothetical protein
MARIPNVRNLDDQCVGQVAASGLTRRHFVGAAAGAISAPVAASSVAAQSELATPERGTPVASPAAAISIDVDALYAISQQLVGGGNLDEASAGPLAKLISADQARTGGFEELSKLDKVASPSALKDISDDARQVVTNILEYWYLGQFDGQPVANRASMFFGLPVWATVPYVTQPTLCKSFGYWATEVAVDNDNGA